MKNYTVIFLTFICLAFSIISEAQDIDDKYNRFEEYKDLTKNKILHGYFRPEWMGNSTSFWYNVETENGEKYYVVSVENKKKKEIIDVNKLIAELSKTNEKSVSRDEIINIRPAEDLKEFTFVFNENVWTCSLPKYKLTVKEPYKRPERRRWSMARRDELSNNPVKVSIELANT